MAYDRRLMTDRNLGEGVDGLGVGLEIALGGDQVDHFFRRFHVRLFQRARHQLAMGTVVGLP
jgi:hypothetical protein